MTDSNFALIETLEDQWRSELGTGRNDFFEAGGTSIRAFRIAAAVADLHPEIPDLELSILTAIFEHAELEAVKAHVLLTLAANG